MLHLVPTPIGNLEDMTFRAVRILKEVDKIYAEDTRVTKKLLSHYGIDTPLTSYHAFNEHKITESIAADLANGANYALVTDAGTPGISDPGFLLVRECMKQNIKVECLPGATAFVPALAASGLPSDKFFFEGFLPHKKGRQTRIKYLTELPYTFILYESPHRLVKCLEQLKEFCGAERIACVARELTKLHEEIKTDNLENLIAHFNSKKIRGEIVVVVSGS